MLAKSFSLPSLRTHWMGVALVLSLAVNLTFAVGYYTHRQLATRLVQSPTQRVQFIRDQLQLRPEQDRAFTRFLRNANVATRDMMEDNRDLARQLFTELSSDKPDLMSLGQLTDTINNNRAQQQRKLLELTLPFLDQLDGGQRSEFLRIVKAQQNPLTRVIRGN